MRQALPLLLSLSSAFMATLCCLPALLFLLFGTSFSFLSFASNLYEYRILFTIISLVCFAFWAVFVFKKDKSCDIKFKKNKAYVLIFAFFVLNFILFYPEILGYFYE